MKIDGKSLLVEFQRALGVDWKPTRDLMEAAQNAIDGCRKYGAIDESLRRKGLLFLVNSKLGVNEKRFKAFLDAAAEKRVVLNYHEKTEILYCFDARDQARFLHWVKERNLGQDVAELFEAAQERATLDALREQLRTGHVVRKDARQCDLATRTDEVLRALFGSFVFCSFPVEEMHRHFNPDCRKEYWADFYEHMVRFHHDVLERDYAMITLVVDETLVGRFPGNQLNDAVFGFIKDAYQRLSNHCYMAILIKPFHRGSENGAWQLFSDAILYAEKHQENPLAAGFFRPSEITKQTLNHIAQVDLTTARFDIANEGFQFRDCFVLTGTNTTEVSTSREDPDLLLLFEKNERDERAVPCPACRSMDVRGNSYSTLGVKSWECQNPICPEKSAFDRGKRFSVASLVKQKAIASDLDQIPESSLRQWKLDVVSGTTEADVHEMLVRHFTLHGDRVLIVNGMCRKQELFGRKIISDEFSERYLDEGAQKRFEGSAFFKRFLVTREYKEKHKVEEIVSEREGVRVLCGDCFDALGAEPENSIDAAVTSPPYYNARQYSQWPNMYCYLYDIFNAARAVYRVVKPGGVYLFNIFDYFDNENTIVFSAMGKKRMILGAYIIQVFRRAGFLLAENVVWYKGEIEGKRNFNQGNRSPYYQRPFNCWEHIFVFQKPGVGMPANEYPTILAAKPVVKMVRGENTLGHSAPFPEDIPELVLKYMTPAQRVLDPYAGSMTTARAAMKFGVQSLSVELHRNYCELGLNLLRHESSQLCLLAS